MLRTLERQLTSLTLNNEYGSSVLNDHRKDKGTLPIRDQGIALPA